MEAWRDLAEVMSKSLGAATSQPNVDFHTGQIISWNSNTANSVRVLGTVVGNVPVLTSASTSALVPGATVGLLRVKTQYFILGRVVTQDTGLVNPQFPIVLYPLFNPDGVPDTVGYWSITTGLLATWEGRLRAAFPYVEVDGVWGNASGSGSTTYAVKLGGTTVGQWTSTGLEVSRKGPFLIQDFIGQDWLKIEVAITASTGTGQKAFQVLGCYFRDSLT